jgi:predicted alpha/beta superfamily hydrolase
MRAAGRHVIARTDPAWVAGLSTQLLLAPSLGAQATSVDAPPVTIPDTELRFVTAESNGVEYKLYVGLPNGYEEGDRRYPVIFTLDADYSFAIAQNVVEHLADRNHLRPAIVVGIAYGGPPRYRLNRTRDYTPTFSPDGGYGPEYQRVSGGAPAFLSFIDQTLIPWLGRQYRTTDERILVGHSYGGLFVSWLAVTRPELFSGLVAVSPSLWYDDGMIFELEEEAARTREDLPLRLYLEVGDQEVNGQRDMPADLARFARALEARGYPSLALRWNVADEETHNSIFPRALSNGLRFVLRGR